MENILISSEEYDGSKIFGMIFGIGTIISIALFVLTYNIIMIPITILSGIIWIVYKLLFGKISMTVTDRRVYGTYGCGLRVDLPLDSIAATGLGIFKSITVSTASGVVRFSLVKNREAIYRILSDLLIKRQNSIGTEKVNVHSSADELKKYKDLLDSGVITQGEFEAKKKQILDL